MVGMFGATCAPVVRTARSMPNAPEGDLGELRRINAKYAGRAKQDPIDKAQQLEAAQRKRERKKQHQQAVSQQQHKEALASGQAV